MTRRLALAYIAQAASVLAQARRGRGREETRPGSATPGEILVRFPGTLRAVNKKEIMLLVEGDQELIFRRIKKTRFFDGDKEALEEAAQPGRRVVIEGRKELNGDLVAVNVIWNEKAKPEVPAEKHQQPVL